MGLLTGASALSVVELLIVFALGIFRVILVGWRLLHNDKAKSDEDPQQMNTNNELAGDVIVVERDENGK